MPREIFHHHLTDRRVSCALLRRQLEKQTRAHHSDAVFIYLFKVQEVADDVSDDSWMCKLSVTDIGHRVTSQREARVRDLRSEGS